MSRYLSGNGNNLMVDRVRSKEARQPRYIRLVKQFHPILNNLSRSHHYHPDLRLDPHSIILPLERLMLVPVNPQNCQPARKTDHRHIPHGSMAIADRAVAPRSGELATIRLFAPGKPDAVSLKQLEYLAGRWFMASFDGWNDFDPRHCEVIGKIVQTIHWPTSWAQHDASLTYQAEPLPAGLPRVLERRGAVPAAAHRA